MHGARIFILVILLSPVTNPWLKSCKSVSAINFNLCCSDDNTSDIIVSFLLYLLIKHFFFFFLITFNITVWFSSELYAMRSWYVEHSFYIHTSCKIFVFLSPPHFFFFYVFGDSFTMRIDLLNIICDNVCPSF